VSNNSCLKSVPFFLTSNNPDGNIPPGVPFEQLPETWVCPVCGADKTAFVKED